MEDKEKKELEALRILQAKVRTWAFDTMGNTLGYVRPPHEQRLVEELHTLENEFGVKSLDKDGLPRW